MRRDIVRMREKYKTSLTKARIYGIVSRIRTRSAFDQTFRKFGDNENMTEIFPSIEAAVGDLIFSPPGLQGERKSTLAKLRRGPMANMNNIYILDNTGGNLV